jgi:hypothetical protein
MKTTRLQEDDESAPISTRAMLGAKDIASLLFASLGKEKSEEEVLAAAKALGLVGRNIFTVAEGRSIIRHLATKTGLVGVVARFAISRGEFHKLVTRIDANATLITEPSSNEPESGTIPASSPTATVIDVAALLAPSLGAEKAREIVATGAHKLGLNPTTLSHSQALVLLESIAMMTGLAGVVARFAKASLTLETTK